jgi:hypothetical protein
MRFRISRNIWPIETPDAAPSVGGNFNPLQRMIIAAAGIVIIPSLPCQPRPN